MHMSKLMKLHSHQLKRFEMHCKKEKKKAKKSKRVETEKTRKKRYDWLIELKKSKINHY